ncbi:unnamed protein product, partial [Acanthoscelides obtectus]
SLCPLCPFVPFVHCPLCPLCPLCPRVPFVPFVPFVPPLARGLVSCSCSAGRPARAFASRLRPGVVCFFGRQRLAAVVASRVSCSVAVRCGRWSLTVERGGTTRRFS